ncbi:M23 family metallopeptidase [Streptomyces sp. DT24]|uniref:M23 family metallopeptidase n=1 Tax=unclassified Streptomyces TaxID=2593676 RepID=UPI0023B9A0B2|nr:M23 family metallopeptidase [Streptomyces sp. AM 4-1-1]WEH34126.1 M23 family metallopeptidase [Streptomyces sp. AM 4-1-1]
MSKRATFQHSRRPSVFRGRGAVVAAGLGVTVMAGAGAAFASGTGDAPATATAAVIGGTTTADSVAKQADAQSQAAKHAAQAKKAAAKKVAGWEKPVSHYKLSATYGVGGNRWAHNHSGQDFAVPTGTKVEAAHSGTVVKAGGNGAGDGPAYGNAVVIKHANGKYSQYAHLSKIDVHIGQHVKTGQKIALSGSTGNSSGPHLHFEIRNTPNYGSAINPVNYLKKVHVSV